MNFRFLAGAAGILAAASLTLAQSFPVTVSQTEPRPGLIQMAAEKAGMLPTPPSSELADGPAALTSDDCAALNCNGSSGDENGGRKVWFGAEYLLWWMKKPSLPPLVTTSPAGTPFGTAGVLGQPGTTVAFGGDTIPLGTFSGTRLTVGWDFPQDAGGIEVSGFMLERRSQGFNAASDADGNPPIARPYFSVLTGEQAAEYVSFNGPVPNNTPTTAFSGGIGADFTTRLWGAQIIQTTNLTEPGPGQLTMLVGFRYLDLYESLGISQVTTVLSGGGVPFPGVPGGVVGPGGSVGIADYFGTRNEFFGFPVGLRGTWHSQYFYADASATVAMGVVRETVAIEGASSATIGGTTTTAQGGLLALSSNIDRAREDEFAVLPEISVHLGYRLRERLTAFVGYNFMYLSSVVRPGEQIDLNENSALRPTSASFGVGPTTPAVPAPQFNRTDFLVHGVTFGMAYNY